MHLFRAVKKILKHCYASYTKREQKGLEKERAQKDAARDLESRDQCVHDIYFDCLILTFRNFEPLWVMFVISPYLLKDFLTLATFSTGAMDLTEICFRRSLSDMGLDILLTLLWLLLSPTPTSK